jgi:hypothetical protein
MRCSADRIYLLARRRRRPNGEMLEDFFGEPLDIGAEGGR